MKTTESILLQLRREYLSQLVDLATKDRPATIAAEYREAASRLVAEIEMADRALASLVPTGANRSAVNHISGDYVTCGRPIDAVQMFLADLNRAATEEEIIEGVLDGGFRGGDPGMKRKIFWSIRVFLNGRGKAKKIIKQSIGRIGLYKWDESRFH